MDFLSIIRHLKGSCSVDYFLLTGRRLRTHVLAIKSELIKQKISIYIYIYFFVLMVLVYKQEVGAVSLMELESRAAL